MKLLAVALLLPGAAHAGAVVNEVLADPPTGVDVDCDGVPDTGDDEFVEIVNLGPGPLDLTGHELYDAQASFTLRHTFGTLVLQPYEAVVVFGGGTPTFDGTGPDPWCATPPGTVTFVTASTGGLSMNNGGDSAILCPPGGCTEPGFPEALDVLTWSGASDQSVVRSPELTPGASEVGHSSISAAAFSPGTMADGAVFQYIAPDTNDTGTTTTTTVPGPCDVADDADGLVINEFLPDPAGSETENDLEWVELYNGSGGPLNIGGWELRHSGAPTAPGDPILPTSGMGTIPAGRVLADGAYLLVGQSAEVLGADVIGGFSDLTGASSNGDGLQLLDCNGEVVDTVIYGPNNDDMFADDGGGVATSLAPRPQEAVSLARLPDGVDTDLSADDFSLAPFPTPGLDNETPPPEIGVVINEFLPDPDGGDDDFEWVELYNATAEAVDLTDWAFQAGTSGGFSTRYTFGAVTLDPGAFLLVGAPLVQGADFNSLDPLGMGNGGSNSDAVRLVDGQGGPVDTVVYSAPNDDGWFDDDGAIATSFAPKPQSNASLARIDNGFDTDQSGADFTLDVAPTPGAANPVNEPVLCVPSAGGVTLNEVAPNPDGEDAGYEWIELHNATSADVSIAGWGIGVAKSAFEGLEIAFPGGTVVPAGGFFVVGEEEVDEADLTFPMDLGNAGENADGVRLVDCAESVVDTLLYGDPANGNPDALPDDQGQLSDPYGKPGDGETLARVEDGVDTDTAADWKVTGLATPGASNVREIGDVDDPLASRGCGCGSDAPPDADAPDAQDPGTEPGGGCTTAPLPLGGLEVLIALVAVGRRRL